MRPTPLPVYVVFFLHFRSVSPQNPTRINLLTILNEDTFAADQATFARVLNAKNAELQKKNAGFVLHSTELSSDSRSGFSGLIKAICNAADASPTPWMAAIGLAEQGTMFAAAMAGQQMGLPVLGYVNTFEPEMFRDIAPDFYTPINPNSAHIAQAVSIFLRAQRWHTSATAFTESSASGRLFRDELRRLSSVQYVYELTKNHDEIEIRDKLSKVKESKSRVQILFVESAVAEEMFRVAKRLNLIGAGWEWIITDASYTSSDDALENYPHGSYAVKLRQPSLGQISRTALDAVSGAVGQLTLPLIHRLQDKSVRPMNCWSDKEMPDGLKKSLKNYTKEIRSYMQQTFTQGDRISFEISRLTQKKTRNRWTRIGNITSFGLQTPSAVAWDDSERAAGAVMESRGNLRVVTRISPPFTIEDYQLTEGGVCREDVHVPCLRITTKSKDELRDIVAEFENAQPNNGARYNLSCCKGLAMDLLQALSRDVGFDFVTYVVADGKDGTLAEHSKTWDGIIGDVVSGAAHMGIGPIGVTGHRKVSVDFSSPFYYSKFSFLVFTTKTQVKLSAFLEPFSWKLWLAIFSALHATAIAAAIFEWLSPFGLNPTGRMRSKNFTLASALTTVYSLFFSHVMAFKAPKSWPNKVLINFWGSFCFIILASYTANHAAIYAGLSNKPNFDNIMDNEDLLARKVATVKGSSTEVFIKSINTDLHAHMRQHDYFVENEEQAVEMLKNGSLDAFIYDAALLDYVQANDKYCTLNTAGAAFGSLGYAVAFPKGSWLRTSVSMAILKYMERGFVDDLNRKWFGGLPCSMRTATTIESLNPRPLNLEDFAGVFLLLATGGAVGLLILGLEHVVYRCLPRMRRSPRNSIWRSRHVMFFSQKLYRFINCVDLVSPNSSAKEFASSLKQGQFIGMFQKSVKKRAKEEELQQKRTRNADNFFETIHELTRNLRETLPAQSSTETDDILADTEGPPKTPQNGDLLRQLRHIDSEAAVPERKRPPPLSNKLSRQEHIENGSSETEEELNIIRSFPEFQKPLKKVTISTGSLKDAASKPSTSNTGILKEIPAEDRTDKKASPRKRSVWVTRDVATNSMSDDEMSSPTTPLATAAPANKASSPLDEHYPYTSLRDWDDVDIEDITKQDLIKMWQSAECDLRLQIQKLAKEKTELLEERSKRGKLGGGSFNTKSTSIH